MTTTRSILNLEIKATIRKQPKTSLIVLVGITKKEQEMNQEEEMEVRQGIKMMEVWIKKTAELLMSPQ